eukprot:5848241-Amphidinium_carterae.1
MVDCRAPGMLAQTAQGFEIRVAAGNILQGIAKLDSAPAFVPQHCRGNIWTMNEPFYKTNCKRPVGCKPTEHLTSLVALMPLEKSSSHDIHAEGACIQCKHTVQKTLTINVLEELQKSGLCPSLLDCGKDYTEYRKRESKARKKMTMSLMDAFGSTNYTFRIVSTVDGGSLTFPRLDDVDVAALNRLLEADPAFEHSLHTRQAKWRIDGMELEFEQKAMWEACVRLCKRHGFELEYINANSRAFFPMDSLMMSSGGDDRQHVPVETIYLDEHDEEHAEQEDIAHVDGNSSAKRLRSQ